MLHSSIHGWCCLRIFDVSPAVIPLHVRVPAHLQRHENMKRTRSVRFRTIGILGWNLPPCSQKKNITLGVIAYNKNNHLTRLTQVNHAGRMQLNHVQPLLTSIDLSWKPTTRSKHQALCTLAWNFAASLLTAGYTEVWTVVHPATSFHSGCRFVNEVTPSKR